MLLVFLIMFVLPIAKERKVKEVRAVNFLLATGAGYPAGTNKTLQTHGSQPKSGKAYELTCRHGLTGSRPNLNVSISCSQEWKGFVNLI